MNVAMNWAHAFLSASFLLTGACQNTTQSESTTEKRSAIQTANNGSDHKKKNSAATEKSAPAATAAQPPKPTPSAEKAKGPFPESTDPAMTDPSKLTAKAPKQFKVKFETTVGDVIVKCHRDWAPHGADRIYNLAKIGFYNDSALFRAVKNFVVQFGIHGNPKVSSHWRNAQLKADPVKESNKKGTLTYAMAGAPTTRTTQLFFNLKDNTRLDGMGFAPVCEVDGDGMKTIGKFYYAYGGRPSSQQALIQSKGNSHLRKTFPKLDYIKTVSIVD